MKPGMSLRFSMLLVILSSILLLGCGSTRPTELYLLTPLPSSEAAMSGEGQDLTIGVGPLTLVEYLDRPQIVMRERANKVKADEFHQWAEPLKDNLLRLLAMNLSTLLSTNQTILFPWKGHVPMDYRVNVDVVQFEKGPDGNITLRARWIVIDEKSDDTPRIHQNLISKPMGEDDDYEAVAAAMSEAFADLCREIAKGMN
jgi:uncharacterized lipoprotein YmbA